MAENNNRHQVAKPFFQAKPGRKEQVKEMFNQIAGRYDFLNHFLSLGIDHLWRRRLVKIMAEHQPSHILDLATGTADLAIAALKAHPKKITGTDISEAMLEIGRSKIQKAGLENQITLIQADSENLPFEDNSFDAAMVAFGVRNYEDLSKGLAEMRRVLKPGAGAFILEFAQPTAFPVKQLYHLYFRFVLPLLGRIISKHSSAYTYLPESVEAFPQGKALTSIMESSGFRGVSHLKLSFGIAIIYCGFK